MSVEIAPELTEAVGIAAGYHRLWDMKVAWKDVNPQPGVWDWSTLGMRIRQSAESGARVLYVMGLTPQWAAQDPSAGDWRWGLGSSSAPARMDYWRDYVTHLVDRFGANIDAYELWNEANLKTFWTGSPDQLAEMTKIAYDIIQARDPSALVLSPSTTTRLSSSAENWLREYVPHLLAWGLPVEGFTIHSYPDGDQGPAERVRDIRYYQAVMADLLSSSPAARELPLWDTEINYGVQGPGAIAGHAYSDEEGAQLLMQTYADSQALGVDATFWYLFSAFPTNLLGVQFTPMTRAMVVAWSSARAAFAPGVGCREGTPTSSVGIVASQFPNLYKIEIEGHRTVVNGLPYITISGWTNLPEGLVIRPWFRLPGQRKSSATGPRVLVDAQGKFTWSGRTGRRISLYFTSESGTIKSNVVRFPAA